MVGRIEVYLHSDSSTPQKGGALIKVTSVTDYAARTAAFIMFCQLAAKLAYAAQTEVWKDVIAAQPQAEAARLQVSENLRETVTVTDIKILRL